MRKDRDPSDEDFILEHWRYEQMGAHSIDRFWLVAVKEANDGDPTKLVEMLKSSPISSLGRDLLADLVERKLRYRPLGGGQQKPLAEKRAAPLELAVQYVRYRERALRKRIAQARAEGRKTDDIKALENELANVRQRVADEFGRSLETIEAKLAGHHDRRNRKSRARAQG